MNALLSQIWNYLGAHRGAVDFALVLSITSMPAPDKDSGKFYVWFYRVTHVVVGAIWRAIAGTTWGKFIPFQNGSTGLESVSNSKSEAPRGTPSP